VFDKENLTDQDYRKFYYSSCGMYEALKDIIEQDKSKLIEAEKEYKEYKKIGIDSITKVRKNDVEFLKNSIHKRTIEIEALESLFASCFNISLK
jgi:hypothetical protein